MDVVGEKYMDYEVEYVRPKGRPKKIDCQIFLHRNNIY